MSSNIENSLNHVCRSGINVFGLECEYLTDPLGIDVVIPRFTWKLNDSKNKRNQAQTGYRVLVASSPEMLTAERADLWDSGFNDSDQSALVPYDGTSLSSGADCYWQVQVADMEGNLSAWSEPARFSIGLLKDEDWSGPWIKHPSAAVEKHLWFRRQLQCAEAPSRALIYVASVGYHELYVNGVKVDQRVLAPAVTRLDKRVLYVTYDITRELLAGDNCIAVWTGPGWSRYEGFATEQALRVQLHAALPNGETVSLATDDDWRCAVSCSENTGGIMFADHGGERIDGRAFVSDWNAIHFDDSAWELSSHVEIGAELSAHMLDPTRVIETFDAQSISGEGIYRLDMGKNFTGWIEVVLSGQSEGDVILIDVANDADSSLNFTQRSEYICNGGASERFCHRFNYIAGRYVTITGLRTPPQLSDITGYVLATDIERVGHFSCSNELFNEIYETDLWTYRANTTEGFTADCPHRERLGYGEEHFATSWGIGFPNYRSAALYTKVIRDWQDVQVESGWIYHTAPQINGHYGGPMWSSAGLNTGWEFYQTYGDERILEGVHSSAKRWLNYLASEMKDGLLVQYGEIPGYFLGDWAAPGQRKEFGDSPEAQFFNNCVYAMNLDAFIQISRILGHTEDVDYYSQRLNTLKPIIHDVFFNPAINSYSIGTQVQSAFALMTGIVPESLRAAVIENIEQDMTKEGAYFDMGSSGLPVLLKYLVEQTDRGDLAYPALSRTTEPSYGHFLARGENTWPEYWNVDVLSRIHTCYTGIAAWFTKSLAGIRPDPAHPGFKAFLIQPRPAGDVTFAEATTESLYGKISSRWELSEEQLTMCLSVPVGTTATVCVPTFGTPRANLVIRETETVIWENGTAVGDASGLRFAHEKKPTHRDGYIAWTVTAGSYQFVANVIV